MNRYIVVVFPGFNYTIRKYRPVKREGWAYSFALRRYGDRYRTYLFDLQWLYSNYREKSNDDLFDYLTIDSRGEIVHLLHADYDPMPRKIIIKSRKMKQIIKPALFEIHMSQSYKGIDPQVFRIRGTMINVFRYMNSNWVKWRKASEKIA